MRKLLYLTSILVMFIACSDDKDDKFPITGLELPSLENPVKPGDVLTIKGSGFTSQSEIWFRAVTSRSTGDVQANVTGVDDNGITFVAPAVSGKQSVLLKENGDEYTLGEMTFVDETGEVEILPRKIVKVKEIDAIEPEYYNVYEFTYNADGTLAKMTWQETGYSLVTTKYDYKTGTITSISDRNAIPVEEVYTLKDGKVMKFIHGNEKKDKDERYEYDYTYTGDLLTKVDGDNEGNDEDETFTRDASNNLTRYEYKDNSIVNYDGSIDFTYGGQLNNLNIDFFYFISMNYFDCNSMIPCLLNVTGQRSIYLPDTMKLSEPMEAGDEEGFLTGKDITSYAFKYEMKDGYITRITLTNTTDNEDELIYEITYEE
ncbi:hypothetical protein [Butyricimonas muris]|uniref:hypothetical protein n=1 Tax=Butyricimonas muris TaxID=3378067 RepID=UPI003967D957